MSDNLLNIGTRIESALPAKTIIDIGLLEYRMFVHNFESSRFVYGEDVGIIDH
ncbi:hypothetical protein TMEN_6459 [Trichophyton mentagrophytes]|nr:hypothetical protein TMEN_6459 [Trichophyton mentagrophytes]